MSQIERVVSCFRVTDGRAWYKQVVSGLYIFAVFAVVSPFLFLAVAIIYGVFSAYPLLLIVTNIGIGAGCILLAAVAVALLTLGYVWAIDGFDN